MVIFVSLLRSYPSPIASDRKMRVTGDSVDEDYPHGQGTIDFFWVHAPVNRVYAPPQPCRQAKNVHPRTFH